MNHVLFFFLSQVVIQVLKWLLMENMTVNSDTKVVNGDTKVVNRDTWVVNHVLFF